MSHYDLDSLVFESAEIVLVTKVRERKIDEYSKITTLRVKRNYFSSDRAGRVVDGGPSGPLAEHAAIEIDASDYHLEPMWGWPDGAKPSIAPEMIVFLAQRTERQAPGPPWLIVPSGLRIFVDGKVHRFAQEMNPGLYGPSPGESGPGRHAQPFDLPAFERELARAIDRVKAVRLALAEPPSASRTTKLIDLATPPDPDPQAFGEDRIGGAIVTALAHEGNVNAMLDAYARTPRIRAFGLRHGITVVRLAGVALDVRTPLHRRLAALSLIEGGSAFELSDKPELGARLATLIDDLEPKIRKAALELRFADDQTPSAYKDAVVRRFKVEKDPLVRIMLFERAERWGLEEKLDYKGIEMPLVAADHENGTLSIRWAGLDRRTGYYPDRLIIEARSTAAAAQGGDAAAAHVTRRKDFTHDRTGSTSSTYVTMLLDFDPPLTPGMYDVDIDLRLKSVANDRVVLTRKITLSGQLLNAPPPPPPPPVPPSAPTPSASSSSSKPLPIPPKPRSCGCTAVGSNDSAVYDSGSAASAAIGFLLLVQRRRSRRSTSPRA